MGKRRFVSRFLIVDERNQICNRVPDWLMGETRFVTGFLIG
jgi:hypothetical protein